MITNSVEEKKNRDDRSIYCSFCGKRADEVLMMIAGPRVFICNECVNFTATIIVEKNAAGAMQFFQTICESIVKKLHPADWRECPPNDESEPLLKEDGNVDKE